MTSTLQDSAAYSSPPRARRLRFVLAAVVTVALVGSLGGVWMFSAHELARAEVGLTAPATVGKTFYQGTPLFPARGAPAVMAGGRAVCDAEDHRELGRCDCGGHRVQWPEQLRHHWWRSHLRRLVVLPQVDSVPLRFVHRRRSHHNGSADDHHAASRGHDPHRGQRRQLLARSPPRPPTSWLRRGHQHQVALPPN